MASIGQGTGDDQEACVGMVQGLLLNNICEEHHTIAFQSAATLGCSLNQNIEADVQIFFSEMGLSLV